MPKPTPSAQACTAGQMWLKLRLPLTGTWKLPTVLLEIRLPRPCGPRGCGCSWPAAARADGAARHRGAAAPSAATTTRRTSPSGCATGEESSSRPMRMPEVDAFLEQVHGPGQQQHGALHARMALDETR